MTQANPVLPIMAHLVLGYPSIAESTRTAEQYIAAGVQILELQIPFSHPTADGPVITKACQQAVEQGTTVQDCIEAIRGLQARYPDQEIIVMSYLNRIYNYGFQRFVNVMEAIGIKNLIIPDLPVETYPAFRTQDLTLKLVPVLAANTSDDRLATLLAADYNFYYLMSDFKITGSGFSLHPRLREMIQKIRVQPSKTHIAPRIGIGFGISSPEQARTVAREADLAIIGSALIQAQNEGKLPEYLESLREIFHAPIPT